MDRRRPFSLRRRQRRTEKRNLKSTLDIFDIHREKGATYTHKKRKTKRGEKKKKDRYVHSARSSGRWLVASLRCPAWSIYMHWWNVIFHVPSSIFFSFRKREIMGQRGKAIHVAAHHNLETRIYDGDRIAKNGWLGFIRPILYIIV